MINTDKENIIINSISKALNTEIKYITLALTSGKNQYKKEINEKKIVICMGTEKLFILLDDLQEVKLEIEYDAITKIYIDKDNSVSVLISLDSLKFKGSKKYEGVYIFIKDRPLFVKSLLCYHTIYFMEKYGIVTELSVKEKNLNLRFKKEGSLLNKGKEVIHNTPEGFEKRQRYNAEFFLKSCIDSENDDIFILNTTKGGKQYKSVLKFEFKEALPIYNFEINKNDRDLNFFATNHSTSYMRSVEKLAKFWIIKNLHYMKKFNLNSDRARWEGIRIEARTAEYYNQNDNKIEGKNENFIFLYLRRKFIPPFYDSYMDIVIIFSEPFDQDNLEISYEGELIVETIADSLYFNEKTIAGNEYINLLEAKVESLLIDEDSFEFFYNNLKIFGIECHRSAVNYVYRLLILLEEHCKEQVEKIQKVFFEKVIKVNQLCVNNFDPIEFKNEIKQNDLEEIVKEFIEKVNTMNSQDYFNQVKNTWEVKVWRYLGYCVDGGVTNDMFNLEKFINIYKVIANNSTIHTYQLGIQISNLLNIRLFNHSGDKLDSKISTIINQVNDIKTFEFNEKVMNILIKTGTLKTIQGIENNNNYANFLKYMLDTKPTAKFLEALSIFLKDISADPESSSAEQNLRKSLNTILSSLMSIYRNTKLCPILLNHSCRCLCILTCSQIDKNNKTKILQDNVIEIICFYLDYPDEKLLFGSLKLLGNILPELRENLAEILYKNSKLIPKLTEVLAGTGVPGTYHSLKTIQSVVIILINLLKMQTTIVKDKLSSTQNRNFIGYLLKFINEDPTIVENPSTRSQQELLVPLQKHIFEFFDYMVRKNYELRQFMQSQYDIVNNIKQLAKKNEQFLIDVIEMNNTQKKYKDLIEPITIKLDHMLKFTFYFMYGDTEIINALKAPDTSGGYNSLVRFINLAFQNIKSGDKYISILAESVGSIYNEFNPKDEEF